MKKESFLPKRNYKPATHAIKPNQKTYESKTEHHLPNISRTSFVNWYFFSFMKAEGAPR